MAELCGTSQGKLRNRTFGSGRFDLSRFGLSRIKNR